MNMQQIQLSLLPVAPVAMGERPGGKQEQLTFNERLSRLGIATVRENEAVYLECGGKRITRPHVTNIQEVVKQHFGLSI